MPGIYGLNGLQRADAKRAISGMGEAMLLFPHFQQDTVFVDGGFAASRAHLGKVGIDHSPLEDRYRNRIWIEGEVYNLADVVDGLGWAETSCNNTDFAAWVLYAYRNDQLDAFLNKIDGYFCAALYDPRRRKVLLISDRYGMRMLYWYHRAGVFSWASEVKGILALPGVDKTFDPTSLPCFMDLGYLMGEHTWFEHIRLIKPATILEYDIASDTTQQHYYWTWNEVKPCELDFDDAVDALHESFTHAVERRFDPNERIGISLSGGLDSRAILAAVHSIYPDYEGYAYTFGIPGCDDFRIAREVASRSNWRHEEFHFSSENWFDPREQMVWNTDGMLDMKHMHGGEFLDTVAKRIELNLNGFAGDVIAGGGWVDSRAVGARATNENLDGFFKGHAHLADLSDNYFEIDKREPGLYLNHVRRFTNMGTVNALEKLDQRKPFYDNAVIEWAFSIPEKYRQGNRVYSVMLQRHFPKFFKDIPWQKTGKPAGPVSQIDKSRPAKAIKRAARLARSYLGRPDTQDYTEYARWIREPSVSRKLESLLERKHSRYQQITKEDWLDLYVRPHLVRPILDKSNQTLRAATIETYLRQVHNRTQE
jgi:asparagine synthetase B (glutamine-hydrolysing)